MNIYRNVAAKDNDIDTISYIDLACKLENLYQKATGFLLRKFEKN